MRQKELLNSVLAAEVILDRLLDPKVSSIATELREKRKFGGYLTIALRDGVPILVALVGVPEERKREQCLAFSQEKAKRLAQHKDHFRSWESRDPDAQLYGGALRDTDYIVSFSGLPEELDEVVSLLVLLPHSGFSLTFFLEKLKHNTYVERLGLEFLQDTMMAVIRATSY